MTKLVTINATSTHSSQSRRDLMMTSRTLVLLKITETAASFRAVRGVPVPGIVAVRGVRPLAALRLEMFCS